MKKKFIVKSDSFHHKYEQDEMNIHESINLNWDDRLMVSRLNIHAQLIVGLLNVEDKVMTFGKYISIFLYPLSFKNDC